MGTEEDALLPIPVFYDATSGIEAVSTGKDEEAMHGWDMRLDYHLPVQVNARL